MIKMMILFLLFLKLLASGDAFSTPSRRDFVQRAAMAAASSAWFSQSLPVHALYERDVGGSERSAETAAYNMQARQTNARLESQGFKLDTKGEEAARLADALGSFSYDPSPSGKEKATNGKKKVVKSGANKSPK